MIKYIIVIIFLLISNIATANHPTPLPNELLLNPITLDCGLIIKEIKGRNNIKISDINNICTYAYNNYFIFLNIKNLKINKNINKHFKWNASFLPEHSCNRCLNDYKNRFNNRFIKDNVIGYTDYNLRYLFMISDFNDLEFQVTFVHELFHSFSLYYGTIINNYIQDEALANEFTKWLGYGI